MKIIIALLIVASTVSATNFKCLSRNGWGYGNGRYSNEGEYSYYWRSYAKNGEYVLFQYDGYGKVYWFKSDKCIELN